MVKNKGNDDPFYKKPEFQIFLAVLGIMLTVIGIIFVASDNINISNLRQSPFFFLRNGEQNITIYYYNTYINQSTPNELASDSLNPSSYSPKEIVKDNCISNITAADGISGEAVLIDDCDVLIVKLKDEETPVRSGTVSLWAKFR
jgi:hypothetical protein